MSTVKDILTILSAPAFVAAITAIIHSINTRKMQGSTSNGSKPTGQA